MPLSLLSALITASTTAQIARTINQLSFDSHLLLQLIMLLLQSQSFYAFVSYHESDKSLRNIVVFNSAFLFYILKGPSAISIFVVNISGIIIIPLLLYCLCRVWYMYARKVFGRLLTQASKAVISDCCSAIYAITITS